MAVLSRNSLSTRFGRMASLCWHIAVATHLIIFRFSRLDERGRAQIIHEWSLELMRILGMRIVVRGKPLEGLSPPNTLLIANHVSWLDIFAIFTVHITRFIAKRELARWPIAGRIIKSAGTLFIDRGNRRDSSRVNEQMAEALEQGSCMAVFPESTTSDGSGLLPFKASLFESALLARSTVQPLAIRYLDAHGHFTTQPAYYDDISFLGSIWRILCMPSGIIELTFGTPVKANADDGETTRYMLSDQMRAEIERCLSPVYEEPDLAVAADLPV